jgi:tetratricopeptide (TPR) repeat protein
VRRALLALLLVLAAQPARAQSQARLLVVPFDNVTREGRIFWLGEASAVLLTDDLTALDTNAMSRQERVAAFERLQVPPAASLTDATVIRIAQLVGAAQVVVGSLQMDGDTLVVHAREIALDTGRVTVDATERGPLPELFAIYERIARRIAPPSPRTSDEIERQHPPIAAFEDFIKGLLAETPDTAITFLTSALKRQPTFDRARLALWEIYADQDDHDEALKAVSQIPATSLLSRRARLLAGVSQLNLKRYDEAFTTFKALVDEQATPAALNNLGVAQMHRVSTPQTATAAYYFTKAAEADPDDPDLLFNLGYSYVQDHDPQAATYWLREAVRRSPSDADAHFVLGAALGAAGSAAEATRERELARRLSSAYEPGQRSGGDAVPKNLERIKDGVELPHAGRVDERLAASGQRDQAELATFYLDRGRRLFEQEHDREAIVELNHAVYLSPYLAEAHLLLGRIYLRDGQTREAIDALKISLWSTESADAHATLGEAYRQTKDLAAARSEAQRALALDPASKGARELLATLDGR